MVGKKCRRKLHTLILLLFLGFSVFYSFTVIRKSFIVYNDRRSAKENKAFGKIGQNCAEIMGCKKTQAVRPTYVTKSCLEKYVILGEPKPTKGTLTVGYIHTEDCPKYQNLERSLDSLFLHLKKASEDEISVVILLRDCSETDITSFLDKMHTIYNYWIKTKVLQFVKIPDNFKLQANNKSQYWEKFTTYSPEYIKQSKVLTRNIAFLWKFSAGKSDYFIQFTDHVTVEGDILSMLQALDKKWSINHWLWAENFRGFVTGSIYKTVSFTELLELLDIFGSYMPVHFILKFYKRNFRISRSVYDEMSEPLPIRENFEFRGDNPAAVLTTSLILGGDVSLQDFYKYRKGYFWAWTPNEADYILIDFQDFIKIKRVLIETGTYLYEDIFPRGVVSVIFRDETTNTSAKPICHETKKYRPLAEFKKPSVELAGNEISRDDIGCIKIDVNPVKSNVYDSWIIIRTLAIFTY